MQTKRFSVLFASSDEATREKLLKIFDEKEYEFVVVDNCKDALQHLLKHEFDLTIFDPDLRELKGWEAVEIIKQIRPQLPIIVTTDEQSYESGLKIAQSGVYFRIGKPVDEKFTRELIRSVEDNFKKAG